MTAESSAHDAVHTLYRHHHGWLLGWLRGKLGCGHDAADLAQDTFVRVLKARNAQQIREPRDYLATIAKGLMVDMYRRRSLERAYLEALSQLPPQAVPSVESRALILEALWQVDRVLDRLDRRAREAFILSQFDGLTYAQIAERLGVTQRTVNNCMVRAIEACCQALAP
ncbi:sigma-70 family RNA polymerase sigma factor [Bordetella genomosp. 9]|uniref:RNA polymerase subunit sigma n=1 Tax=Bordetella genomosp. 9 TaxID=1416803 RepID=A0A1W6Z5E7_9BORD|nr:sigma-70 family RNA polymerase sigma factor [Bordetella genomosp. 9]ARP88404.1 RNA polymerase subunit sigma [Bordetella genomosp. 9]ARP92370.1 RNA polymerase subunit sigma [Bordetella genomosp. 9]